MRGLEVSDEVVSHPRTLSVHAMEERVELTYFLVLFALGQVEALSAAFEATCHFHALEDALQRDVADFGCK